NASGRPMRRLARVPIPLPTATGARPAWIYIMPVFFAGSVTTSVGLTIAASDRVILAGMVLTGLAVIAMWLPGKGGLTLVTASVIGSFISGSALTAMALTVHPSNTFFLWGMVLT